MFNVWSIFGNGRTVQEGTEMVLANFTLMSHVSLWSSRLLQVSYNCVSITQLKLKKLGLQVRMREREREIIFTLRVCLCRRIGRGRHLLISGDSISYQSFITFLNFLRSELSETQYPFHGVGFEPVCVDVLGGEGFNLAWVCSPLLNTTEVTQYIEEWNIEILLMNRGAWFRSDQSFVTELHQFVQVLQARYPHLLVVYRNTSPGKLPICEGSVFHSVGNIQ